MPLWRVTYENDRAPSGDGGAKNIPRPRPALNDYRGIEAPDAEAAIRVVAGLIYRSADSPAGRDFAAHARAVRETESASGLWPL
jgi:hypothetical protein